MRYDFKDMITNGRMAKELRIDPKTLRKWAVQGKIPSYVNPANNYRLYAKNSVLKALKLMK